MMISFPNHQLAAFGAERIIIWSPVNSREFSSDFHMQRIHLHASHGIVNRYSPIHRHEVQQKAFVVARRLPSSSFSHTPL
jgi:hypothetical protein